MAGQVQARARRRRVGASRPPSRDRRYDIPVLHVDGQYWTKHRVTAEEAVAAIGEAAAGDFAPRRGQPDASRAEV